MRFATFQPGMMIEAGPRSVSAEEIVEFASRYDPQWFHTDPQRAGGSRWKGLIASGWHSCAIAMELGGRIHAQGFRILRFARYRGTQMAGAGAAGRRAAVARRGARIEALGVRPNRHRAFALGAVEPKTMSRRYRCSEPPCSISRPPIRGINRDARPA